LKPDVPLHFTAFHPDYHMLETAPTPPPTLQRARAIAIRNGLEHVYVGNVHDPARQATLCPTCGARAIGRDGYKITAYALDPAGACLSCGARMAGVFAEKPGVWGSRRMAVDIERYAA
jgi:pyruvate formate lyase activating enzyme